jgi:hypothetical protein
MKVGAKCYLGQGFVLSGFAKMEILRGAHGGLKNILYSMVGALILT